MPESRPVGQSGVCHHGVSLLLQCSDCERCHAGVHAAVSWTYVRGERAEESLLRIRRALKEPRGWWGSADDDDYNATVKDGA